MIEHIYMMDLKKFKPLSLFILEFQSIITIC